jgi:hypothetical protein
VWPFTHGQGKLLPFTIPEEVDVDSFTDPQLPQDHQKILHGLHGSALNRHNDIASHHPGLARDHHIYVSGEESGMGRRAVPRHHFHEQAIGEGQHE